MGGCGDPGILVHLEDEIGDVYAALHFFIEHNALDNDRISRRVDEKLTRWNAKRERRREAGV